jgi:hypothetical protein
VLRQVSRRSSPAWGASSGWKPGASTALSASRAHRSAEFKACCQQLATQVLALLQDADTVSLDADAASLIGADAAWLTDDDDCRPLLDTHGVS